MMVIYHIGKIIIIISKGWYHSERHIIWKIIIPKRRSFHFIAESYYSVVKRLGLWTHLPIREDCPSATLQNRVPTSGCAYRVQIINLPPPKLRRSVEICCYNVNPRNIAVLIRCTEAVRYSSKNIFQAVYRWRLAVCKCRLHNPCHNYIYALSVTHSLVSRMLFYSTIFYIAFANISIPPSWFLLINLKDTPAI